ncbi:shikimate dehydrogenase [Thermoplasma sp.]|uniref:shikimate dehydrogenase n=1 Tax=Thermoplasma sp. TaxID=1973142 RepID=UPI0026180DD0|nr:shikimate dehydrogenase [Thermoplasma sp.]
MSGNRITGLIGHPVSHSIGQIVYNRIFRDEDIDAMYLAIDVHDSVLPIFMKSSGFMEAFNVTIPHKVSVIPFLDRLDPIASEIGSVNLVINRDGLKMGYNTDYDGIDYALSKNGASVTGKRVLVSGTGGIARTVIRYLLDHGAREIDIITRNVDRAKNKLDFPGIGILQHTDKDYDIFINCTPLGTFGQGNPFRSFSFRPGTTGIDMVYNPVMTEFLESIRAAGGKAVSGLDVFIGQGLRTLDLVFGIRPERLFRMYSEEALDEIRQS